MHVLAIFSQLGVHIFDPFSNALIFDHFREFGEVKCRHHVFPVFADKITNLELFRAVLYKSVFQGTHGALEEPPHLSLALVLLVGGELGEARRHLGEREISQNERIIVCKSQVKRVQMTLIDVLLVKKFEEELCLVKQVHIFLLCEDFLTAIALLFIIHVIAITAGNRTIKHIDYRNTRLLNECDIVEDGAGVGTDDKDFFEDLREELFYSIRASIVQELNELCLIDNVKESVLFALWQLLGDLDDEIILRLGYLVQG